MSDLTLGIDIGTSGIRSAVLDKTGQLLGMARAPHIQTSAKGQDRPDALDWWAAVETCVHAQLTQLRDAGHDPDAITRIGIDGTSGTMVLTDEDLRPVTRALMYNSAGFSDEAQVIARIAPENHIAQGVNSALARALRLQSEDCDGRARHLLHQADFIAAKLTGRGGFSDDNNALKTGFDPETRHWPDWIGATGLRVETCPTPLPPGTAIAPIDPEVAAHLGLSPDVQVHAGTTDSIAAFLAAAPLEPGAAVTSLGTTLAIKILSPTRIDAPEIGLYSHRLGAYWLVGGASNTGGGVLASLFSPEELIQLSGQIDPAQSSPLEYYPLTKPGERFPINDPALPPRLTPRPASDVAFLHGLLESMSRIEAQCYAAIADRGGLRPTRLFTAGGGAKNPVWTAIRARVLGVSPQQALYSEAAIGTARLIAQA